jgi:hypothetical protein
MLRRALHPFVTPDIHCLGLENRGYTVRSIYLDSTSLRYYHEKQAHLRNRKKIRIRAYNEPNEMGFVFFEIKRKFDSAVVKERVPVPFSKVEATLASGSFRDFIGLLPDSTAARDVGRRLFYHLHKDKLLSTSLAVYEREAFQGCFDSTFRVTLDHNLRGAIYPRLERLYDEEGLLEAFPGSTIFEIKYDGRLPEWIRMIIARFGLIQRSVSKYCTCVDLFDRRRDSPSAVLANAAPFRAETPVCPESHRIGAGEIPASAPTTNA